MKKQATDVLDWFDSGSWSLANVVAWVIWRSKERVVSIIEMIRAKEGHIQIFDVINEAARTSKPGMPPDGGVLPFPQAQAEIWEELKRGRLRAIGVKAGEAIWSQISSEAWFELDYLYCGNGRSNAIGSSGLVKYFDVMLPRADVLILWSASTQSKRGRKRSIPQNDINNVVFELLNYYGDFMDNDPGWHTQAQLEVETRVKLNKKFKKTNVPLESTLRKYVSLALKQWRVQKAPE
jgi:hypothetical protein